MVVGVWRCGDVGGLGESGGLVGMWGCGSCGDIGGFRREWWVG